MFEKSIRGYVDHYVNSDNEGNSYRWTLSQTSLTLRADGVSVIDQD